MKIQMTQIYNHFLFLDSRSFQRCSKDTIMEYRWLEKAERKIGWIALPNLALYLVVLQGFGFLTVKLRPEAMAELFLIPQLVLAGDIWRLLTFMAIPMSTGFWMIFIILFLYYIVNTLENEWGEFKATFYLLISVVATILYSFITGYPVTSFTDIEASLFLAAAMLYPQQQIMLFLVIPVKMIWLAYLTAAFIVYRLITGDWYDRGYMAVVYLNYLIFFGPYHINQIKAYKRRREFQKQWRR